MPDIRPILIQFPCYTNVNIYVIAPRFLDTRKPPYHRQGTSTVVLSFYVV